MGIVASVGCAIHCAAMPFIIAYLPGLGLSFLADEAFHKWMFLIGVLIGLSAFLPGWRKHRQWSPLAIGATGLGLIGFAAFGLAGECCAACETDDSSARTSSIPACCANGCCEHESAENAADADESGPAAIEAAFVGSAATVILAPWITPLGGILLVGAHLLNRRFGCICGCCGTENTDLQ